jgi:hypothetical protein
MRGHDLNVEKPGCLIGYASAAQTILWSNQDARALIERFGEGAYLEARLWAIRQRCACDRLQPSARALGAGQARHYRRA